MKMHNAAKETLTPNQSLLASLPNKSEYKRAKQAKQICHPSRPCRTMICDFCSKIRRAYFIHEGSKFIEHHKMLSFVTVAFNFEEKRNPFKWSDLFTVNEKIWKSFYRHPAPKYIRCLALGIQDEKPHIHFVFTGTDAYRYMGTARKIAKDCTIDNQPVYSPDDLLGYLFDQNFAPTHCHIERPPRFRVLTASRGLKCGFPNDQLWKQMNKQVQRSKYGFN